MRHTATYAERGILPNTGACGISEALVSGPYVPANTWSISVPCPCLPGGPGDTGGGNDDGTGDPNPGDWGGGGFDGPINVGGVNVPGWYVPYYIDAINWTSRRPGSGGFQVNILSLSELLNRGDRDSNDDHSFGGGGELHDTPIFQNCLDNAFPAADGTDDTSTGGDGLGGGEALWALLTDMFGQSTEVINSINAIDSHIRSQTGAPASQPALTQNQWRYLILHPSEAADIAHALTTDQTTPATVSAYLTLKSTFDSCNSLPGLNFDLLTEEPGVFNALANHLATNPTNTEALRAVNRVLALHECIGLNAGLVPHVLGNEEMLNFFYGELAAGACGEAGFKEAALNAIAADKLNVACDLENYLNEVLWEEMRANAAPGSVDHFDAWTNEVDEAALDRIADLMEHYKLLNPNAPCWYLRFRANWTEFKEGIHALLDVCGVIEGLGAVCDLANGTFYALEGEGEDAVVSLIGAIPFGSIVTSGRALKFYQRIGSVTRRFAWTELGGKIVFSHSKGYREVWKGVYPELNSSDNIAHHVIPKAMALRPMVQKAARANPNSGIMPFHMNMPSNGYPVHATRHSGSHPNYSRQIEQKMEQWMRDNGNATPEETATALARWQDEIKALISSSSNNINDIDLPDIPLP